MLLLVLTRLVFFFVRVRVVARRWAARTGGVSYEYWAD